jgi:molybdopterin-binding protein
VATSAANQLKGEIIEIIPAHYGNEVVIDVGFSLVALLTSSGIDRLSIKPGDVVYACFKATAIRFIKK